MIDFTKDLITTKVRTGETYPARFLFQRFNGKYSVLIKAGGPDETILTFDSAGLSMAGAYKLSNPPRKVERRLWIDGLHAVGKGTTRGSGPEYRMQMSSQMDENHLIHDEGNNHLKLVFDADTGQILEVSLLP